MIKPKVLITKTIPKEVENYIAQHCDYKIRSFDGKIDKELLFNELQDTEGLLTSGTKINEELLSHAPKLKVVSNISVGYNNFDLGCMKARKVMGTNTPGVLDDTVADLVFALVLSAARRISELDAYVKKGKWRESDNENLFGVDVHHSTLGIIGMGRIGETIAKRARLGFDMEVLYYNRSMKPKIEKELGVEYSSLEDLLKKSDYIVVMTPLTKETEHIIDYKEFDLMKKSAIVINASRGKTINEEALIDALKNKRILAAGLDVYSVEPVNLDNPLLKMPNVVTIPHIGSATSKTRFDMSMLAAKNLIIALSGHTPPNLVPELK
ncbi:bifunctional glyoxylate/hydroxypyruvate reductase B [Clostridium bovifaecis]|uniref:Bifunctional glyoxylate/hydroxypyruvate reductase B n=1 Tax=Clostridium bovifaecis TaxID=2184719 RepID=A0A6I6EQE0_9CLOT|nr:bifunctional glyoxylate/hydroxypyruvate reductase B [Clostridium bovifaecis]